MAPLLKEVRTSELSVPIAQVMRFAIRHDLSYPEVIAFVHLHARLPHDLAEFLAPQWRQLRAVRISA